MSDISELKETIEELRKEKYLDLPAELIAEILTMEAEWLEDKGQALRRVAQAVERHIAGKEGEQ